MTVETLTRPGSSVLPHGSAVRLAVDWAMGPPDYPLVETFALGIKKNRLIETVL